MLSFSHLEDLLVETTALLDKIAQLEQAADNIKQLSGSITQSCQILKPRNESLSQDLERLSRLHEVIQTYVYAHASAAGEADQDFLIGFENQAEETAAKKGGRTRSPRSEYSPGPSPESRPFTPTF